MSVIAALVFLVAAESAVPLCRTAAVVGDDDLVAELRVELDQRGVPLTSFAPTAALLVHVERTDQGIRLELRDRDGRAADRAAASVSIGATLVESWLRTDIASPLLMARAHPAPPQTASSSTAEPAAPAVSIALESSIGTDRSFWTGGRAAACVSIRAFCPGFVLRMAYDPRKTTGASYDRGDVDDLRRFTADALLGIDRPFEYGRATLTPGLAAGVQWLVANTTRGEHDGNVARLAFATEARLVLGIAIARAVSVELGVSALLSPFRHRDAFEEDGFTIPGNPLGYLRAGLGLRYGRP